MSGVAFGVSYFGVRDPRHARADLDEIARAGFSAVTHTLSEHDLRYHEGDVARLVEETKSRGLEAALDPWGVGGLFGGEAYSEVAATDLSCRQVDAGGRSVPACCPSAPATRSLLTRWARTAAGLEPHVLFWDEPHYHLGALLDGPARPCCRCEWCERAWADRGGPGKLPPEGHRDLASFRTAALRDLLEAAIAEAPGPRHALCLLPRGEFEHAQSDAWSELANLDGISRLCTDPYWMDRPVDPADFVRRHSRDLRAACDASGHEMEVWIQGIRIPAGDERTLVAGTAAAVEAGAERIAYWSFRGTERMSWLACGDPDAAWEAMRTCVTTFGGG